MDTVKISLHLICTIKRDGRERWVAGCPALDLFSQGRTEKDAKHFLVKAIEIWVEDCLERGTLDEALREVGFDKVHSEALRPGDEHITVIPEVASEEATTRTFPVQLSIPAYQAAALLSVGR